MRRVRLTMGMVGIGLCLTASRSFAQGSLTPPGAPAPTMKTLAQVEPRTPVTNAPYTITQPGSYYLTTNLSSTGHGVVIQTSRVTLDLMGFSLTGDGGGGDYGIWLNGVSNVVVRGGIISGFGKGMRCDNVQNSRIEGMAFSGNLNSGVMLNGNSGQCNGNTVANCVISDTGSYGLYLSGSSGQCNGNTVANCAISDNGSYGVFFASPSGQCAGNTIVGCAISGNALEGVMFFSFSGQCDGNTIAGCTISGNASYGVHLNGETGQCDGNKVAHCVLSKNTSFGICIEYADGNRIENNHVSGTTGATSGGISTFFSSANLILQNTCVGQTNNYSISANDTYGPIVTSSGALATTNGAAALSPWANFSR